MQIVVQESESANHLQRDLLLKEFLQSNDDPVIKSIIRDSRISFCPLFNLMSSTSNHGTGLGGDLSESLQRGLADLACVPSCRHLCSHVQDGRQLSNCYRLLYMGNSFSHCTLLCINKPLAPTHYHCSWSLLSAVIPRDPCCSPWLLGLGCSC